MINNTEDLDNNKCFKCLLKALREQNTEARLFLQKSDGLAAGAVCLGLHSVESSKRTPSVPASIFVVALSICLCCLPLSCAASVVASSSNWGVQTPRQLAVGAAGDLSRSPVFFWGAWGCSQSADTLETP